MDEKMNPTNKNIKIKTTAGTMVNVTCSYAEDKDFGSIVFILSGTGKYSENGNVIAGAR